VTSNLVIPKLHRPAVLRAVIGILLCIIGFFLTRRESYEVRTVLATAGGCNMATDIYEPRSGSPVGSVVLFHGLFSNKKVMSLTAEDFANQELRVFVPDLPGHGKTPGTFSPERVEACAEALVRELSTRKAIIPQRTLLAGHSMGGAIATRVAADVSVAGVIAISPAPMHPLPEVAPELLLFPTPPILAAHSLVLSASWEPASIRRIAEDLVTQSSNTPIKYETIPRTTHVSILFASATFEAIRSWTSQTLGTNPSAPYPKNMPALGCIFGILGLVVLAPPFLREMSGAQPPEPATASANGPAPFLRTALFLVVFSTLAVAVLHFFVPFQFLHIFQGGYVASFLFLVGVAMLVSYRITLPSPKSFSTLTAATSAAAAVLLLLLFGTWLELTFYEAWLTPARWLRLPLLAVLLIPWHLAEEFFLGAPAAKKRMRRLLEFLTFRLIVWFILVAAIFYLHSGQFLFVLLATNILLFSLLQRMASDVIRLQTRSIAAAAIFSAILLAGFALAILPIA
jgi:pimeloyl-ACP methyl ester carboxylesterase